MVHIMLRNTLKKMKKIISTVFCETPSAPEVEAQTIEETTKCCKTNNLKRNQLKNKHQLKHNQMLKKNAQLKNNKFLKAIPNSFKLIPTLNVSNQILLDL